MASNPQSSNQPGREQHSESPREGSQTDTAPIPLLEWLFAVTGAIIVVSAAGLLIYKGLVLEQSAPKFEVIVTEIDSQGEAYTVKTEVHNRGGQTASKVHLTARLVPPVRALPNRADESTHLSGSVESRSEWLQNSSYHSEATIDYLPGDSMRIATFLFQQKPAADRLRFCFESYQDP